MFAIENDKTDAIDLLLTPNTINFNTLTNETALHIAIRKDNDELFNRMIAMGADIEATSSTNSTPLHAAAKSGNCSMIQTLLTMGANASIENDYGNTPFNLI